MEEYLRVLCVVLPHGSDVRLFEPYEGDVGCLFLDGSSFVKVAIEGNCAGFGSWLIALMGDVAGLLGCSHMRDELCVDMVSSEEP